MNLALRYFIAGLLTMLLLVLICFTLAALPEGQKAVIVASILLGMILGSWIEWKLFNKLLKQMEVGLLIFTGIVACFAAIGTALPLHEAWILAFGKVTPVISVSEAANHPDAIVFQFNDGEAHPEYMAQAYYHQIRNRAHEYFCAYPVGKKGWTPAEPALLWVVFSNGYMPCEGNFPQRERIETWGKVPALAYRLTSVDDEFELKAVQRAEKTFHIRSGFGAPILHVAFAMDSLVTEKLHDAGIPFAICAAVLLVVMLGWGLRKSNG